MNFKPLGKRVLVLRIESETQTKSGILLTSSTENNKHSIGIIKAISKNVENSELTLEKKIAFKEYKTSPVLINDVEFLVIEEDDILGILE